MIYIYNGSTFQQAKYRNAEHLIEGLKLDRIDDPHGLNKRVERGNPVYCWISPYESEINQKEIMYWSITADKAEEEYHQAKEEV